MAYIVYLMFTFGLSLSVSGTPYCRPRPLTEDGDVKIASIVQIHGSQKGKCGTLSANEFQITVALKWVVDILNGGNDSTKSFIPGVKIGYDIYDDCGLGTLASRRVSDILSTVHQEECLPSNQSEINTPILGLVGTTISQTTTTVSELITGTNIPIVGLSATLSELSNKTLHPNFIRPVPSDNLQAKIMIEIAEKLKWNYIIGIHTADNYGSEGFREFKRLATDRGICISKTLVIRRHQSNSNEIVAEFLRNLLFHVSSTVDESLGVMYFGQVDEAIDIFNTIENSISKWQNSDKFNRINWLMSDGVGTGKPVATKHAWLSSLLLTISPANLEVDEIKDYFINLVYRYNDSSLSLSWRTLVVDFIKTYLKCDPFDSGTNMSNCDFLGLDMSEYYHPNTYISSAIDSVVILATTLKRAHEQLCNSQPGICSDLLKAINNNLLKTDYKPDRIAYRDISRRFVPDIFYGDGRALHADNNGDYEVKGEALYDINIAKNGNYYKVGYYKDGKLNMDAFSSKWQSPTKSWCKEKCDECLESKEFQFHYIPGDILILGLFPVHVEGPGYGCGDFRESDNAYIVLLSFISSIYDLREKTGLNFGAVIFDDCYNPLRATHILNLFFSGTEKFVDKATDTVVDPDKVIGVVGAQSSSVALSILPILSNLQIPLVSYSATSPDLDDRISYPYFFRTVPSDSLQVDAMYNIIKLLNATHVSAINVNNNYGRKAIMLFKKLAESKGICVEEPIELSYDVDEVQLINTISTLRRRQSHYVVFFGLNCIAIKLLNEIKTGEEPLIFIASETWGQNQGILEKNRAVKARGAITLSVRSSHVSVNNFKSFLENLGPQNESTITWFRSFWKTAFKCNILGGFQNNREFQTCSPNQRLDAATIQTQVNNQRIVQTINAVFAIGLAYQSTIGPACGGRFRCRPQATDYIPKIRLFKTTNSQGTNFRIFDDQNNGRTGFTVNNIQRSKFGNTYSYVNVGSFEDGDLKVNAKELKFYGPIGNIIPAPESQCRYKPNCGHICPDKISSVTKPSTGDDESVISNPPSAASSDSGFNAAVIVLSIIVIILFVFFGILLFLILRHGKIINIGPRAYKPELPRRSIDVPIENPSGDSYVPDISLYQDRRAESSTSTHERSTSSHPTQSSSSLKSSSIISPSVTPVHSGNEGDNEERTSDPNHVQFSVPATYLSLTSGSADGVAVTSGVPCVKYNRSSQHNPMQRGAGAGPSDAHLGPTMTPVIHPGSPQQLETPIDSGYLHPFHERPVNGASAIPFHMTSERQPGQTLPQQRGQTSMPSTQAFKPDTRRKVQKNSPASQDKEIQIQTRPRTISERSITSQTSFEIPDIQRIIHNNLPSHKTSILPNQNIPRDIEYVSGRSQNDHNVISSENTPDNPEETRVKAFPPEYKRSTSYITGEELNPFPTPCKYSPEMEV